MLCPCPHCFPKPGFINGLRHRAIRLVGCCPPASWMSKVFCELGYLKEWGSSRRGESGPSFFEHRRSKKKVRHDKTCKYITYLLWYKVVLPYAAIVSGCEPGGSSKTNTWNLGSPGSGPPNLEVTRYTSKAPVTTSVALVPSTSTVSVGEVLTACPCFGRRSERFPVSGVSRGLFARPRFQLSLKGTPGGCFS